MFDDVVDYLGQLDDLDSGKLSAILNVTKKVAIHPTNTIWFNVFWVLLLGMGTDLLIYYISVSASWATWCGYQCEGVVYA